MDPGTAALIGGLVLGAVGTGVSFYGQQQASRQQAAIANYNAEMQRRNADIQRQMAEYEAATNAQMMEYEAAIGERNAAMLTQQAGREREVAQVNATRQREDFRRIEAIARARRAKSGVAEAGTVLDIFSEQSGVAELNILEGLYEGELAAREYERQAEGARAGAEMSMLQGDFYKFRQAIAPIAYRQDLRAAELTRLGGLSTAQATRTASYGTLLEGFGSAATSYSQIRRTNGSGYGNYRGLG